VKTNVKTNPQTKGFVWGFRLDRARFGQVERRLCPSRAGIGHLLDQGLSIMREFASDIGVFTTARPPRIRTFRTPIWSA